MPSGAGHDAQMLARICPAAMIFTPSVGGLSHNIAEHTHPADVTAGADVLLQTLLTLAVPSRPRSGPRATRRRNARIGEAAAAVPDDAARGAGWRSPRAASAARHGDAGRPAAPGAIAAGGRPSRRGGRVGDRRPGVGGRTGGRP